MSDQSNPEAEGEGIGSLLGLLAAGYVIYYWWPALIIIALIYLFAPRFAFVLYLGVLGIALYQCEEKFFGIEQTTPAPAPERVESALERIIRVAPGDSLSKLALEHTGDAERWRELYRVNRAKIGRDPSNLIVGQVLVLPESWE